MLPSGICVRNTIAHNKIYRLFRLLVPAFSIKLLSDLFIIKSRTRKLILACGIEISFPYNIRHKNYVKVCESRVKG